MGCAGSTNYATSAVTEHDAMASDADSTVAHTRQVVYRAGSGRSAVSSSNGAATDRKYIASEGASADARSRSACLSTFDARSFCSDDHATTHPSYIAEPGSDDGSAAARARGAATSAATDGSVMDLLEATARSGYSVDGTDADACDGSIKLPPRRDAATATGNGTANDLATTE